MHGLTGVGHNLLTGQWHHWGFEENFDSSSFPHLYHEAIMLFYCQRGSLTYKSQACNLNSPKLGHHGALSDVSLNTAREWFQQLPNPFARKHRGLDTGGEATDWGLEDFDKGKIGIFHLKQVWFFFLLFFPPVFFPFKPV